MACLFYNMRGFYAPGRARQVFELIIEYKVDIVCLQETIKDKFTAAELRKLTGGVPFTWHYVPARGHFG